MIRTRLLLVLAGILSLSWCFSGFYWANNSHSNDLGVVSVLLGFGMILGPIFFLASVLMFVFSFFNVSEAEDGRLMYYSSNLHWRLLKKCFELEGNVSLCKAYWLTSLLTLLALILCGATVLFSWAIYTRGILEFIGTFKKILPMVAFMGSIIVPVIFLSIWPKSELARKLSLGLMIATLAGWFVVMPFHIFLFRDGLTVSGAVLKYLAMIGEIAMIMIPMYAGLGLILLLAKYFSSRSSDSLLKRLFTTLKENMCPILFENSVAGK